MLDYFWKGNDLMGYVEELPTQAGGMLRDLYIAGFQLGMSSRGWATLKEEDGYIVIQEDFELIVMVNLTEVRLASSSSLCAVIAAARRVDEHLNGGVHGRGAEEIVAADDRAALRLPDAGGADEDAVALRPDPQHFREAEVAVCDVPLPRDAAHAVALTSADVARA